MFKMILATLFFLLLALPASAVDLTCTVPAAAVPRGVELCEEIRTAMRVRTADWSNDACATVLLRMGFVQAERRSTRKAAAVTVQTAVSDAVESLETNFPFPATQAFCSDGVVDTEFGEECDDGNTTNGDGCSSGCRNE